MAVIHDVIPAFELFQPTSVDDALALQSRYGAKAWVLAGGLDSFDWFKDRIKRPEVVIDLSQVKELRGVRQAGDGLEIGAMTTLTEVVRDPAIRGKFNILPNAAETFLRMPVAGITEAAGRAIAPAATFATPTRPPASTANTPSWTPTAASPSILRTRHRR
jgi:xanthine dehydrogenase iron-sulfur cluster and FAD-binding subunit A